MTDTETPPEPEVVQRYRYKDVDYDCADDARHAQLADILGPMISSAKTDYGTIGLTDMICIIKDHEDEILVAASIIARSRNPERIPKGDGINMDDIMNVVLGRPCDACGGDGQITDAADPNHMYTCPACKGTGTTPGTDLPSRMENMIGRGFGKIFRNR